jgi:glycosyltransferase involved in cell wall biosynthesis
MNPGVLETAAKASGREKLAKMTEPSSVKVGRSVCAQPKVSVVIPAYNLADYIAETLDSALAQTFRDFEIIIVNDGSPDTVYLEKVLEKYFDRLVYIKQKNGGAAKARNTGIAAARADLIAFLDGDDIWEPDYLTEQVREIEARGLEMVYTDAYVFGAGIDEKKKRRYSDASPSSGPVTTISLMTAKCNPITSGTLARKDALEKAGLFKPFKLGMEDFDLWFRLARRGAKMGYQMKPLVNYRVRVDSLSGNSIERVERNKKCLQAMGEVYELDAAERAALENQLLLAQAELDLETGKFYLVEGDKEKALRYLKAANSYYKKAKLSLIIAAASVAPKMMAGIFQMLRPEEYNFVSAGKGE